MTPRTLMLSLAAAALLGCAADPPLPIPAQRQPVPVRSAPEPVPAGSAHKPRQPGGWRVSLISVITDDKAARLSQRFADKGYRVEIEVVDVAGTTWQRLVFPGQNSRREAQALLEKLEQEFNIQNGWILR